MTVSAPSGWIWEKLDKLEQNIALNMSQYRLAAVMDDIYTFVWDDLADWYIEYLKTEPSQLDFARTQIFEPLIKLIHPFVPFETEVLWQEIQKFYNHPGQSKNFSLLIDQKFELPKIDITLFDSSEFELIKNFVIEFRRLRGLYRIDPATKTTVFSDNLILQKYNKFLNLVARVQIESTNQIDQAASTVLYSQNWQNIEFSFDLLGLISDPKLETERSRKDLDGLTKEVAKLESLLLNQGFMSKASPETIQKTKSDLESTIFKRDETLHKIGWLESHVK